MADAGVDLWTESGGRHGPRFVFLHGSGACTAAWDSVVARLPEDRQWTSMDLPGHGRSDRLPRYTTGAIAAAVAAHLDPDEQLVLVGHSLGGLIGLAVADPIFGLDVRAVVGLAIKVTWTEEELVLRNSRLGKPPRIFATRQEALDRFARVSGLSEATDFLSTDRLLAGVRETDDGFVLSHDPATAAVPPLTPQRVFAQVGLAEAPVLLACGDQDATTSPTEMGGLGEVRALAGAGHNLHLSHPDAVAALINEAAS
jgi:pimeloyl-ACP methyl ester carboxylesterase